MEGVTDLVHPPAGMTDSELYEHDFPAWCDLQADRLRRAASIASGQDSPDWPHLIEEIEDMGAAERRQVESLLVQAMVQLLNLQMMPNGRDARHWIIETRAFLDDAARTFAPRMRRAIDMDQIYQRVAFRLLCIGTPSHCPFTLDDLTGPFPDVAAWRPLYQGYPAANRWALRQTDYVVGCSRLGEGVHHGWGGKSRKFNWDDRRGTLRE